jgi:hypothetical protein
MLVVRYRPQTLSAAPGTHVIEGVIVKHTFLKAGAAVGVVSVAVLAAGPAMAASTMSQATAHSLDLTIAGTSAVSQVITASNDGSGQVKSDGSTVPTLASLIPGNNALGLGVAPQDAGANSNGTSYACAGLAGTGGGLVQVGDSACNINGAPLTLNLGSLNLNLSNLLGGSGAITSALNGALGSVVLPVGTALDTVVSSLTSALAATPLGDIGISGGVSAVEANCSANPTSATGFASIVDTSGNHTIPISVTIPNGSGGTQSLVLANLDVNVPDKPGGTDVLLNLSSVTQALETAVEDEVNTALGGAIKSLGPVVADILTPLQSTLIAPLTKALEPALAAISQNVLTLTVNDVTPSDGGKQVEATALNIKVLPAAAAVAGSSLIEGTIGHVTCGPDTLASQVTPTPSKTPTTKVPQNIDSGLGGGSSNTGTIIAAMSVLLAAGGAAGAGAYRRYWMPRG